MGVLKEVELEEGKDGVINLKVDGVVVVSTDNVVASHNFWDKLEDAANQAQFKIEKDNPKMNFDGSLQSLAMSPEEIDKHFLDHLNDKHPDMNNEKIIALVKEAVSQFKFGGPEDENPNPFLKFSLNSHLIKSIIVNVIEKYNKG